MLISCDNKGCLKGSNALLKEDTMEVVCQECGLPITNISDSMKRALKSFGQIVRSNERKAFLLHCKSCRANRDVVLDQNNDTICKICYSLISITPAFKIAMEVAGSGFERIDTSKKKKTAKKGKK